MLKLITGDAHTLPAIAVIHLCRSTTAQMQEDLTTRRLHGSCISSGECAGHRRDTTNIAAPQVAIAAPQVCHRSSAGLQRRLQSRVRVLTEGKGRGRRRGARVGDGLNGREGAAACNTHEGHRCPYESHVRLPRPDSGPELFTYVENGKHQQHPEL